MPAIKSLLLFGLLFVSSVRGDIGDDFRTYVNKVLPQSHELAKQSAKLIEQTVIQNGLSLAQSHLEQASRDMVELNVQLIKLESPDFFNGELSDPLKLLTQIAVLSQMVNFVNRIEARLEMFDQIMKGLGPHCDDPAAFANYNIDSLGISFTVPNFSFFTGIKVGFTISGDYRVRYKTMNEGKDEDDFPFVGPIIRGFKNKAIRNSIEEQADRIRREQPTTEKYRGYALEICRTLAIEANQEMQPYKDLSETMREFVRSVPLDKLSDVKSYLRELVTEFETEQNERLTQEVKLSAAQWLKPKEEALFQARMGIQVNQRLHLNSSLLEKIECGGALDLIEELLADISLSETYSLNNRERLLPEIKKRLAARKSRCPEEAL